MDLTVGWGGIDGGSLELEIEAYDMVLLGSSLFVSLACRRMERALKAPTPHPLGAVELLLATSGRHGNLFGMSSPEVEECLGS